MRLSVGRFSQILYISRRRSSSSLIFRSGWDLRGEEGVGDIRVQRGDILGLGDSVLFGDALNGGVPNFVLSSPDSLSPSCSSSDSSPFCFSPDLNLRDMKDDS